MDSQISHILSRMDLKLWQRNVFPTLILGKIKGFGDTGSRLLRCSQLAILS
jgi:crotonobetainyl-CoA:carnitine CoA-transferase CaiB-like acyl-CoA transferase